jgi:hypothetical protein
MEGGVVRGLAAMTAASEAVREHPRGTTAATWGETAAAAVEVRRGLEAQEACHTTTGRTRE